MNASILLPIALMLAASKIGGEFCERFLKQPAVLAEIVFGVILGASVLGWVNGASHSLQQIAQIGAVLLLFEVGLEGSLSELLKLGGVSLWVGILGALLPLAIGSGTALALGFSLIPAVFIGATFSATSVGITARVIADMGLSQLKECKIVLGAAVVDDVVGLIILGVCSGVASNSSYAATDVVKTIAASCAFLVGAIGFGLLATPIILRAAHAMRTRAAISSVAIVICFLTASAGRIVGLSPIVGAFAAGLVLASAQEKIHFQDKVRAVGDIFVPIFFVMMGAQMNVRALTLASIGIAGLFLLAAVAGKVIAAVAIPVRGINRLFVGVAMIPRGEVGLIFAGYSLLHKVIDPSTYAVLVIVVIATTFATPPLLRYVAVRTFRPEVV